GRPVCSRDGSNLLTGEADSTVRPEKRNRGGDARQLANGPKVECNYASVRVWRPQNGAFELTFKCNIDRIFGATGDLLCRLNPRPARLCIVKPSGTRLLDGLADACIRPTPAKMAGKRCGYVGSRRRDRTVIAAPLVVKRGGLDDKSRCAETALERITFNE